MIVLLIRTDQPQAELYLYNDNKLLAKKIWLADRSLATTINKQVQLLLDEAGKDWTEITGLGIYSGPGSFTGLRIGHVVANTMAYSLSLPIVGSGGEDWISNATSRLKAKANDNIALPNYGAPARVTMPRK